ncbi:GntR family transcriptional regulator [Lacticaseibacillus manihotivorans]|uniref:GntR family transcriptional regulator n=1 Tax=Lacticaseibacillus manihotivorans TaxID=88233 RepID=UPI000AD9DE4E
MATPKYQMIADEIRRRIHMNVYPAKSLIPDQNTLAKEFGVSRMTIKKKPSMA